MYPSKREGKAGGAGELPQRLNLEQGVGASAANLEEATGGQTGEEGLILHQCDSLSRAKQDLLLAESLLETGGPSFDDKTLRDAAAAEVAALTHPQQKADNRNKRLKMTPEERAKLNRDRNREHARNTRLRKKAYTNKLKELVKKLTAENEKFENEREQLTDRVEEQANLRVRVVNRFFEYLLGNQKDRAKWTAILDESFTFVLPPLPKSTGAGRAESPGSRTRWRRIRTRTQSQLEAQAHGQGPEAREDGQADDDTVLKGIDAVMREENGLLVLLRALRPETDTSQSPIRTSRTKWRPPADDNNFGVLTITPDSIFQAQNNMMCKWRLLSTENREEAGSEELQIDGTMKCTFSPQNRLLQIEMIFDLMSILEHMEAPRKSDDGAASLQDGDPADPPATSGTKRPRSDEQRTSGPLARIISRLQQGQPITADVEMMPSDSAGPSAKGDCDEDGDGAEVVVKRVRAFPLDVAPSRKTHFLGTVDSQQVDKAALEGVEINDGLTPSTLGDVASLADIASVPANREESGEKSASSAAQSTEESDTSTTPTGGGLVLNNTTQLQFSKLPTALGITFEGAQLPEAAVDEENSK